MFQLSSVPSPSCKIPQRPYPYTVLSSFNYPRSPVPVARFDIDSLIFNVEQVSTILSPQSQLQADGIRIFWKIKSVCFNYPQSPVPVASWSHHSKAVRNLLVSTILSPQSQLQDECLIKSRCSDSVSTILSPQSQLQVVSCNIVSWSNLFQLSSVPSPSCKGGF